MGVVPMMEVAAKGSGVYEQHVPGHACAASPLCVSGLSQTVGVVYRAPVADAFSIWEGGSQGKSK